MWDYLAENPTKDKYDAIRVLKLPPYMASGCSCCEYVKWNYGARLDCNKCPLVDFWKKNGKPTVMASRACRPSFQDYCMSSIYDTWELSHNTFKRSYIARQIANAAQEQLAQHENKHPGQPTPT